MSATGNSPKVYDMATMPLRPRHFAVLVVGCMEQIIGTALSGLVGIVIPMMLLLPGDHGMSLLMQGVLAASGLLGIAVGSPVIGRLSDRHGYLFYYRLCPVLITLFSLLIFFFPHEYILIPSLFLIGAGVGGGYTLDSDYISEMMPDRWKQFMVGVAKSTSALGFVVVAGICWLILSHGLKASEWNVLFLILSALGVLTFIMRIPCRNSPRWLMDNGQPEKAEKAARYFLGNDVTIEPQVSSSPSSAVVSWADMFRGDNLRKVIFSGIPWACEGVAVYGVGVFLPILVMALGIDVSDATGMAKVVNSVELTTVINSFIIVGFVIGLLVMRRVWHVTMLTAGFILSAIGMAILLWGYVAHLAPWVSIAGFLIFELGLNGGPHLITFVIPTQIYDVDQRGAGSGIAAMFGKLGAIAGVFIIPAVLHYGGVRMVLAVCIAVMLLGAFISYFYGREVLPHRQTK